MQKTNSPTAAQPEAVHVTCPACGLLCDDLAFNQASQRIENNPCSKSIAFFAQATATKTQPSIAGKPCDLSSAIEQAAALLQSSQQPLFAGLGTEVQGMRALMQLAAKTNATLDHMHSESSVRNTLTLQNGGWLTTTLSEIKNRADVIVAIGTDIASSHPRFFEKVVWNTQALFEKPEPEVIYIGVPPEKTAAGIAPSGKQPTVIDVENQQLPEIVNALNALLASKKLHRTHVAGVAVADLTAVVEQLKAAHYAVLVWSASSFKFSHAELTIQSIVQLINKLNENTRAAGFPLNSGDGDSSVNNVSTWRSGYPTRSRYNNGTPQYDTYQFSTQYQLAECDAMLWVSTFNPHVPPQANVPTIVIGHPDTQFAQAPDVFIPVGIPGVDHAGLMFRVDSSITLPLKKLRESALPSLTEVITKIEAAFAQKAGEPA